MKVSDTTARSALADEYARLRGDQRTSRFRLLDSAAASAIFSALDVPQQRDLLDALGDAEAQPLLEQMCTDDRVRLLDELPQVDADAIISTLGEPEREATELLRRYPRESAGRMMTPRVFALRHTETVEQALARIRRDGASADTLVVLPVTDGDGRLDGVVRLSDLVLAPFESEVADVMDTAYPSVHADEDREPVARLIQEEDLLAVPVVDAEGRLLGVVTVDDAMEVLEHEETEDIARMASASEPLGVPYHAAPVRRLVRSRIIWLLFLIAAATLTVTVLGAFEGSLQQAVTLAVFIPLLIGTGGNCGSQAATTMTRALAVGDVRFSDLVPSVLKEARVGLLLGLLFGAIGFPLVSLIWSVDLAATVSLTLVAICTWATAVGALLPLLASRIGVDPAVVSAPLVTTLVDATGLLIYFGVAQLLVL
jgi:magnesium transporter